MTLTARKLVFFAGAVGLAAMLAFGVLELPPFGEYRGPYGDVIVERVERERKTLNAVAATAFDYRGVDTMGEEFILYAAVIGVALLLRAQRDETEQSPIDAARDRRPPDTSDATRIVGLGSVGAAVTHAAYIITHGHLSPGGGFQGGVVAATALIMVYLAGEFLTFDRLGPEKFVEPVEAVAAASYVLIGLAGLALGAAFLDNVVPLGRTGDLWSSGTILLLNVAVGLEVAAAFVLMSDEFLEQTLMVRRTR